MVAAALFLALLAGPVASRAPEEALVSILKAEDERRWDAETAALLKSADPRIRRRAALAAGRIGGDVPAAALLSLLEAERDGAIRETAVFALGETESHSGIAVLLQLAQPARPRAERARAIEALGKVAGSMAAGDALRQPLAQAISNAIEREARLGPRRDRALVLLGLTAMIRARPDRPADLVARFLSDADARVRADAANVIARLRARGAEAALRERLAEDPDATVQANAARALGALEDRAAYDLLWQRAAGAADSRVRVSAIRALAQLNDGRAASPLLQRAEALMAAFSSGHGAFARPAETSELLEIGSAVGRILADTGNPRAVRWLRQFRDAVNGTAPEVEIALARIAPTGYISEPHLDKPLLSDWRRAASIAQALGALAARPSGDGGERISEQAQAALRSMLEDPAIPPMAVADVLRALAAFKPVEMAAVLHRYLAAPDVIVRATAAELLAQQARDAASQQALAAAMPGALRDPMNDAALAITDALGKYKDSETAASALRRALDSSDHLVRRRAAAALLAIGAGDVSARIGAVTTHNTAADYRRALARRNGAARATVTTDKGAFVIELLPEDAPLTVDNFIRLAESRFFDGVAFHRVVPNFVIQGGDPRGDGTGGPGRQIRCEINTAPYTRGAVGMALSGKDTGGSQWFVTHAPQPHLDGGYTVFGRVVSGMSVVDRIARWDRIRTVTVSSAPNLSARSQGRAKRR